MDSTDMLYRPICSKYSMLVKNVRFDPRWVLYTAGLLLGFAFVFLAIPDHHSINADLTMSAGNIVGFHIGINSDYHVDLVICPVINS